MSNLKIFDTLSIFDKKLLKKLDKFVRSPYHNDTYNADSIIDLFDFLLNESPKSTEKKDLQHHFFPDTPFKEKGKNAIDNLLSSLHQLIQNFIVQEELKPKIQKDRAYALSSFFAKHGKQERVWPIIEEYRKQWKKNPFLDYSILHNRFELEEQVAYYNSVFRTRKGNTSIIDTHQFLDQSFLSKKVELGFFRVYQMEILGLNIEPEPDELWNFIVENYSKLTSLHTPLSNVFFQAFLVTQNPQDSALLQEYKTLLNKYETKISKENLRNLYVFYRAFAGRQYKLAGETNLTPILFKLYQEHLEKGYLTLEGNRIPASTMKLLVNVGLKLKEYQWVTNLLKSFLPKNIATTRYPKEFHRLCQAELLFAQQQYEEAEQTITYRLFKDPGYSLSCDVLLVKIYFTTKNDLWESRVRALELKVRRSNLSKLDQSIHLNFISVIRKIDKYLFLKDQKKIDKVKTVIQSSKPMIQREWLMELIT